MELVVETVLSQTIWTNILKKSAATPEPQSASRGVALAPRPSQTTALRFDGERTDADERLGEWGPPGEGSPHSPGWRIIVNTWKSQCHCNSACIIINASPAVLCCISVARRGWVGWSITGLLGRLLGRWVGSVGGLSRLVIECVRGSGYLTFFVL